MALIDSLTSFREESIRLIQMVNLWVFLKDSLNHLFMNETKLVVLYVLISFSSSQFRYDSIWLGSDSDLGTFEL